MNQIWEDEILDIVILEMLREKGFYKVNKHALKLLKDILINQSEKIMCQAKQLSENGQRNEVNFFDVLNVVEKDEQYLTELTQRLQVTQNKHENTNQIFDKMNLQDQTLNNVKSITKEVLDNVNQTHNIEDEDIIYQPNVQDDYIISQYPLGFIRSNKDKEKPLYVSLPDPLAIKETKQYDQTQISNIDIKNKRTEEMRNFELENCKVQAIDKKIAPQNDKEILEEKEVILKNPKDNLFAQEADEIDNFNIFEISNSQMFQLIFQIQIWIQNLKLKKFMNNILLKYIQ